MEHSPATGGPSARLTPTSGHRQRSCRRPTLGWAAALRAGLVALPLLGLSAGLVARTLGHADAAALAWSLATLAVLAFLLVQVATSLARGDVGLDLVAVLSMGGARPVAALAGAVIALMFAGGQALEAYAAGRASRAMTALIARQPRTALREEGNGADTPRMREVPLADLAPATASWCGPATSCRSTDASPRAAPSSTCRASPANRCPPFAANAAVLSGSLNVGQAFTLLAERRADESTYAGIVRLVEAARAAKAPMARLADRYALVFLLVTLVLAAGPGPRRAMPCGRWPCWWWRHPAR